MHNLTNDSEIQNHKETRATFFKNFVSERNPDLLIDICDYWIN